MLNLTRPLAGPIVTTLAALRLLGRTKPSLAILLYGPPGGAKTDGLLRFALERVGAKPIDPVHLTYEKNEHPAIEHINGQSLDVAMVRAWRDNCRMGNLFSDWTIKLVDEFDSASQGARNEILSLLDKLPPRYAILCSTNNYAELRKDTARRVESRFKSFYVAGPSDADASAYLIEHLGIEPAVAAEIVKSAVPDGMLLNEVGVNMRLCIEEAETYLAAQESMQLAA